MSSRLTAHELDRLRAVATHRVCAPEHAAYVRTTCLYDRGCLPRWHQSDRGPGNAHRGHHTVAPDGAYATIPAWSGRQAFLALAAVVIGKHAAILAAEQVSPELLLMYLRVRTGYVQDQRTGRRCIVRPKVLASVLDCAENTVHRCQRAARRIGLEVVVMPGRMLTADECFAARRRGSPQRGLSTEVAFTIPRRHAALVGFVTPTSGRGSRAKPRGHSPSTHAASGEKRDAAPPRPPPRRAGLDLARALTTQLPWLRGEAPGRCATSLARFARAPLPWSATQVGYALADLALRRGITTALRPEAIATRPAVVLAGLLRQLDEVADHPDAPAFAEPEPCRHPDCDGHGWIQLDADTVAKCPRCPAGIRRGHPEDHDDDDGDLPGDPEPCF